PLMDSEEAGDDRDGDRHRRDQDRGDGGGNPTLAHGDRGEGDRELDQRKGDDRGLVSDESTQRAAAPGDGQQNERGERDAAPGHIERGQLPDRELDEKIGNAPGDPEGQEGQPGSRAHGYGIPSREPVMRIGTWRCPPPEAASGGQKSRLLLAAALGRARMPGSSAWDKRTTGAGGFASLGSMMAANAIGDFRHVRYRRECRRQAP